MFCWRCFFAALETVSVMSDADVFKETFEKMGIEKGVLQTMMNLPRATLWKYLEGKTTNFPATALTLIELLRFLQQRDEELLREWVVLQDYGLRSEVYLDNPELWKEWKYSNQEKIKKDVLQYLKSTEKDAGK